MTQTRTESVQYVRLLLIVLTLFIFLSFYMVVVLNLYYCLTNDLCGGWMPWVV